MPINKHFDIFDYNPGKVKNCLNYIWNKKTINFLREMWHLQPL